MYLRKKRGTRLRTLSARVRARAWDWDWEGGGREDWKRRARREMVDLRIEGRGFRRSCRRYITSELLCVDGPVS